MSQGTYNKSISLGIEVVVVLAIAVIFVIIMLLIVFPQMQGANHSLIGVGNEIVDMFSPKK